MKVRLSMLTLTLPVALGIALAQTTPPPNPTPQDTPQSTTKTQPNAKDAKTGPAAGSASTTLTEMKTTTFKGVLVDWSCASHSSTSAETTPAGGATQPSDQSNSANRSTSDSGASCSVSSNSSEFGMKLDDGKTVRFDLVGNQRAQDALKSDKRWSKSIGGNKPIRATVSGVMSGDKLIVASIH